MCRKTFNRVRNSIAVFGLVLTLSACGGGGGGSSLGTGDVLDTTSGSSGGVVSGTGVGVASVNWQAPVQRADGSALSLGEIQGYRIYYGTESGNYGYSVDVKNGSTFAYQITGLPAGTYYIAMTAIDLNGQESGLSGEAVKTVSA